MSRVAARCKVGPKTVLRENLRQKNASTDARTSPAEVFHPGSIAGLAGTGKIRSEERHVATMDPEMHPHANVGRRGSNKHARATFCVDCSALVDFIPQKLRGEMKQVHNAVSSSSLKET